MAELFGAIAAAVSLLDLILKRVNTISRFKKDADRAATELTRRSRELDLRTKVLDTIRADLKPPTNVPGAPLAVECVEDCVKEMVQLKTILKLFEAQFATGKSWRAVLQTKLEYAWKKEDMDALYRDISSANEKLADAVMACQLYLATTTSRVLGEVKDHDLPAIATSVLDISAHGLPPIHDAVREIRTLDVPAMNSRLDEIRTQVPALADSVQRTRTQDLPAMACNITTSVASNTGQVVRLLGTESQHTRDTVMESGRLTSRELNNLGTSIPQMIASNNEELQAILLPPIREHMDGFIEIVVQGLRTSQDQSRSSRASSGSQSSVFSSTPPERFSYPTSAPSNHPKTKQSKSIQWHRTLPLGLGSISLQRELRQRILIRLRRYPTENDTSLDTETIYQISFIPNAYLFGGNLTGCNWKFSLRTNRRLPEYDPVFKAITSNSISSIIQCFEEGSASINDVSDYDGKSLFLCAVENYRLDICRWLIDNGADVHATDDDLQTAIYSMPARSYETTGDKAEEMADLLIKKCQLDPTDKDRYGRSVLEVPRWRGGNETFARIHRLSMPFSTQPEAERIIQTFQLITSTFPSESDQSLGRLKFLINEYRRHGFEEERSGGLQWWHTAGYLRRLIFEQDESFNGVKMEDWEGTASKDTMGIDEDWIEQQVCELIRSGIDLHEKFDQKTVLDSLLHDEGGFVEKTQKAKLLRWLKFLHKAQCVDIKSYLRTELRLHPGGEVLHKHHCYQEYQVFDVRSGSSSNSFEFTSGIVVAEHRQRSDMPGAWQKDVEIEACERQGLQLMWRDVLTTHDIPVVDEPCDWIIGRYGKPSDAVKDTIVYDWELADGRKGSFQKAWTISTAGFDRGDYSVKTASVYTRDYWQEPMWIEYPESWIYLAPPWKQPEPRQKTSGYRGPTLIIDLDDSDDSYDEDEPSTTAPGVVSGIDQPQSLPRVNVHKRRKSI